MANVSRSGKGRPRLVSAHVSANFALQSSSRKRCPGPLKLAQKTGLSYNFLVPEEALLRSCEEKNGRGKTAPTEVRSVAGDLHALDEDRADLLGAAAECVIADRDDVAEHVPQIAGNRDFLDGMHDFAAFNPVTGRTT